jgi:hypothetical protein
MSSQNYTLQILHMKSSLHSRNHATNSVLHSRPYRTELSWTSSSPESELSYFTTGGLPPIWSSWRQAPSDSRLEFFFSNWTITVTVLMYHLLWRGDGFVSYEYAWLFVKCTFRTYSMLLKGLHFALRTSPLSVQALQSRSCLSYLSTPSSVILEPFIILLHGPHRKPFIFLCYKAIA